MQSWKQSKREKQPTEPGSGRSTAMAGYGKEEQKRRTNTDETKHKLQEIV